MARIAVVPATAGGHSRGVGVPPERGRTDADADSGEASYRSSVSSFVCLAYLVTVGVGCRCGLAKGRSSGT